MHTRNQEFDEQALLMQVRAKDEKAFDRLLNMYMTVIRQETWRFRDCPVDEDDLAQVAALGLYSAAKTYREDGGASFATYARVCIRRRLLNAIRKLSFEELPHESPLDFCVNNPAYITPSPERLIEEKEEEQELLSRLKNSLSTLEYRILVLHIASYSYNEIAQILNIEPKAVDNAVQRVRRKLKKTV